MIPCTDCYEISPSIIFTTFKLTNVNKINMCCRNFFYQTSDKIASFCSRQKTRTKFRLTLLSTLTRKHEGRRRKNIARNHESNCICCSGSMEFCGTKKKCFPRYYWVRTSLDRGICYELINGPSCLSLQTLRERISFFLALRFSLSFTFSSFLSFLILSWLKPTTHLAFSWLLSHEQLRVVMT